MPYSPEQLAVFAARRAKMVLQRKNVLPAVTRKPKCPAPPSFQQGARVTVGPDGVHVFWKSPANVADPNHPECRNLVWSFDHAECGRRCNAVDEKVYAFYLDRAVPPLQPGVPPDAAVVGLSAHVRDVVLTLARRERDEDWWCPAALANAAAVIRRKLALADPRWAGLFTKALERIFRNDNGNYHKCDKLMAGELRGKLKQ
jgi:hypothetical protein